MEITSLSSSRVNAYLHCPYGYWQKYVAENYKLPNGRMTRGLAVHKTIEFNYSQKYTSHRDLSTSWLKEYYAEDFDQTETEFVNEDPGAMKDGGINALDEYQKVVAPGVQPVEVEEKFVMSFNNVPWSFTGRIDLVDDKGYLREKKTTSTSLKTPRQDHLTQIYFYFGAYRRKKKATNLKARFDYTVCGKKSAKVISFDTTVTESDEKHALSLLAGVANGIQKEVFFHNRGDNFCSRRYCAYWRECEEEKGGTVRD
jgi:hypothetical protein